MEARAYICIHTSGLFKEWPESPSSLSWLLPQLPQHPFLLALTPGPSSHGGVGGSPGPHCGEKAGLEQYLWSFETVTNSLRDEISLGPQGEMRLRV